MDNSLYLVTGEEYSGGRSTLEVAEAATCGGIDILQMREKGKSRKDLVELGKNLSVLCRDSGVVFIVNDDPLLAKEIGADGVHLGQEDVMKYPIEETRSILGKDGIIGISTHSVSQFEDANRSGCDYIAFGPIFYTRTKDYTIGIEGIKKVLDIAEKPVVFIGGIDPENIDAVLREGARNIAVIRAIVQAENITTMVSTLKKKLKGGGIL